MGVLKQTREALEHVCVESGIDLKTPVTVQQLAAEEAIGDVVDESFAIRRGKEVVIEAAIDGVRGQAFTDRRVDWSGTLADVFAMSLEDIHNRAVVVAALNALAARLGLAEHVIHCTQDDPMRCGKELVRQLAARFEEADKVLLVGLQPSILEALVERYGAAGVRVLDLDAENIGKLEKGVRVGNGTADVSEDIAWCDLMLVTGSSVVNGTLDDLLARSEDAKRPLVFFGNTIAAVAAVVDLERLCPFGGD